MSEEQKDFRPLSRDELNELAGEELPERAAMSLVNANIAIPINAAVAANVLSDNATAVPRLPRPGRSTSSARRHTMSEQSPQEYRPLSRSELDQMAGEELPERAAMSLINANVAAPINLAAALNVASDNSVAYADATQTAPIIQSN